jgi:predicted TIM-barrel fold metal-dependent hydrolase
MGWTTPEQRAFLGYENLMWGSDYPHIESAWPQTRARLRDVMAGIAASEVEAMVGGNAVGVYGLDPGALARTVERIGPRPDEIVTPAA